MWPAGSDRSKNAPVRRPPAALMTLLTFCDLRRRLKHERRLLLIRQGSVEGFQRRAYGIDGLYQGLHSLLHRIKAPLHRIRQTGRAGRFEAGYGLRRSGFEIFKLLLLLFAKLYDLCDFFGREVQDTAPADAERLKI